MIEMRDITKHFGAVQALKEASLSIPEGKITALVGSNGSGKSTLVKVLAGLVSPNSGTITLDGRPVAIRSGNDAQALGISTAFQDLSLIPTMTVEQNLLLGNEPTRKNGLIDREKSAEAVRGIIRRFELNCAPDDFVQSLPPSTQSMLEIAKAVFRNPRVLLLDEATATLHQDEIDVLFSILRELSQKGVAIVYVTHRMQEIYQICDTATVMRSGETIISGPVSQLSLEDIVFYMTGQKMSCRTEQREAAHAVAHHDAILHVKDLAVPPRVRDISLVARAGEIVGIGGLEGQGQGELIRAVLGVYKPLKGSIHFLGKPVRFREPADAVRAGIGFISGERNREAMFPLRSIAENIFAGNAAKGRKFTLLTKRAVTGFASEAVKTYRIKIGKLSDAANTLSGGNQQKLVIARWIAINPKVLILDEPSMGLSPVLTETIFRVIDKVSAEGMTVILVEQNANLALQAADRGYVMDSGNMIMNGCAQDLLSNPKVQEAYLGA